MIRSRVRNQVANTSFRYREVMRSTIFLANARVAEKFADIVANRDGIGIGGELHHQVAQWVDDPNGSLQRRLAFGRAGLRGQEARSAVRSVGEACVSSWTYRGSLYHFKQ